MMANAERSLQPTAGRTYTVKASVKLDATAPQALFVLSAPTCAGHEALFQPVVVVKQGDTGTDGWVTGSTSYTVPEGLPSLSLILFSYGTGTMWLDDVTIE